MAEVIRMIFASLLDRFPGAYELHQISLFHGPAVTLQRWPLYPTRSMIGEGGVRLFSVADANGEITFPKVVAGIKPDIVFGFNDVARLLHLCSAPSQRPYKVIAYANLAGFPFHLPEGNNLNQADLVVTMSEFSRRVALASFPGLDPNKVTFMYSPADLERFTPVTEHIRHSLREAMFPEWMPRDAFVLGWVGRSQWRKQVWLCYKAIHHIRTGDYLVCAACGHVRQTFCGVEAPPGTTQWTKHRTDPRSSSAICERCGLGSAEPAKPLSDVFLWLHMPTELSKEDWPKRMLEELYGVSSGRDLHYTQDDGFQQFKRPAEMASLYQIWDTFLYLTGGEGFGVPAWEAMCSALPTIYTNYSAHAEYLTRAGAGLPVGGTLQPEPVTCIFRMVANECQCIEAIRTLYFNPMLRLSLGRRGRAFCGQYSLNLQAERWHRIFHELAP